MGHQDETRCLCVLCLASYQLKSDDDVGDGTLRHLLDRNLTIREVQMGAGASVIPCYLICLSLTLWSESPRFVYVTRSKKKRETVLHCSPVSGR